MNFSRWLNKGDLQKVVVSDEALSGIAKMIDRDLEDARISSLSCDRRFATAYGAALGVANYVIRKSGYRVSAKVGHHKVSFDIATELIGAGALELADYFDICRRKRNRVDYDLSDVVSEGEVDELISVVEKFKKLAKVP